MCYTTSGQTRIIKGKIIGSEFPRKDAMAKHEFWDLNEAIIFGNDSLRLGTANQKGEFALEVPENIQTLRIGWLGMYPDEFILTDTCEFLEVILLPDVIYDYVTLKKEERLRKKDRKVLANLYREAFEQGIFKHEKPCR
jgi:hypothetical protein